MQVVFRSCQLLFKMLQVGCPQLASLIEARKPLGCSCSLACRCTSGSWVLRLLFLLLSLGHFTPNLCAPGPFQKNYFILEVHCHQVHYSQQEMLAYRGVVAAGHLKLVPDRQNSQLKHLWWWLDCWPTGPTTAPLWPCLVQVTLHSSPLGCGAHPVQKPSFFNVSQDLCNGFPVKATCTLIPLIIIIKYPNIYIDQLLPFRHPHNLCTTNNSPTVNRRCVVVIGVSPHPRQKLVAPSALGHYHPPQTSTSWAATAPQLGSNGPHYHHQRTMAINEFCEFCWDTRALVLFV